MLFGNTMKWVDLFVPMDTEVVEGSKIQAEGSNKRTREELKSDNSKKQKVDENVEAEVGDEAEIKKLMEIVPDDEVAIDAIPLATKADGSSRRPEEAYERVLWGDLKVMFEPDVESEVWRNLQGYNVTVWKLFSSSGVHFMRFQNLHIFILVKMDDPNITMEEYIRLEEEKALSRGEMFNWQTATYGKMEYCEDEDDCFTNFKSEFPTIVLDDTLTSREALSWEPTVSPLNDNEIDFIISFDESDDEDYTPEVSYSNDLDFFKDFENEFPAIVYNDALTSKSDFLTIHTDLAETMIWYILKKACVELIRAF
ncbi:hypothetical protein Tco_0541219 [Tanacetum coccineum]